MDVVLIANAAYKNKDGQVFVIDLRITPNYTQQLYFTAFQNFVIV